MKVSVIYSNYNRMELMEAGFTYLIKQTMPREDFEVVVIDDGSSEDYEPLLRTYSEKLRIQWIRYDHTKHDIYDKLNPGGSPLLPPADEPLWYHTPAISHNIGFRHARGEVLCVTQPEVLMKENTLEIAYREAVKDKRFIYCMIHLSEPNFRIKVLSELKKGETPSFATLKTYAGHTGSGGIRHPELYYYLAFILRDPVLKVNGIDEDYQQGAYAEDDDFRFRLVQNGWPQSVQPHIEGIHLDHTHINTGRHQRGVHRWQEGAKTNRAIWKNVRSRPIVANSSRKWGDPALITRTEIFE